MSVLCRAKSSTVQMDPAVAWFQEEQDGPAKRIWLNIWETELENIAAAQAQEAAAGKPAEKSNEIGGGGSGPNLDKTFNMNRKKQGSENRASTYNMNKNFQRLCGKYGGCPWRLKNYNYSRGIIGLHQEIDQVMRAFASIFLSFFLIPLTPPFIVL